MPAGYAGRKRAYPVLYLLDADYSFGGVVEAVRFRAAVERKFAKKRNAVFDIIVVGIGYRYASEKPTEVFSESLIRRSKDFTPTTVKREPSGGAKDFLDFIRNDLKPMINSDYRTDPQNSTIYGVSLGGLFALYALFHKPDTFNRYIAISPSLWWDKKVAFKYEREYFLEHKELPARLFLSVGTLEDKPMEQDLRKLVQALRKRNYKGLEFTSHIYEGVNHLNACEEAMTRAIRYVFLSA